MHAAVLPNWPALLEWRIAIRLFGASVIAAAVCMSAAPRAVLCKTGLIGIPVVYPESGPMAFHGPNGFGGSLGPDRVRVLASQSMVRSIHPFSHPDQGEGGIGVVMETSGGSVTISWPSRKVVSWAPLAAVERRGAGSESVRVDLGGGTILSGTSRWGLSIESGPSEGFRPFIPGGLPDSPWACPNVSSIRIPYEPEKTRPGYGDGLTEFRSAGAGRPNDGRSPGAVISFYGGGVGVVDGHGNPMNFLKTPEIPTSLVNDAVAIQTETGYAVLVATEGRGLFFWDPAAGVVERVPLPMDIGRFPMPGITWAGYLEGCPAAVSGGYWGGRFTESGGLEPIAGPSEAAACLESLGFIKGVVLSGAGGSGIAVPASGIHAQWPDGAEDLPVVGWFESGKEFFCARRDGRLFRVETVSDKDISLTATPANFSIAKGPLGSGGPGEPGLLFAIGVSGLEVAGSPGRVWLRHGFGAADGQWRPHDYPGIPVAAAVERKGTLFRLFVAGSDGIMEYEFDPSAEITARLTETGPLASGSFFDVSILDTDEIASTSRQGLWIFRRRDTDGPRKGEWSGSIALSAKSEGVTFTRLEVLSGRILLSAEGLGGAALVEVLPGDGEALR